MPSSATDQLLEEYLRVINHKDGEIHRLLTEVEKLQLELKKKEDRYKSRLRELKIEIDQFQSTAELATRERQDESQEFSRLRSENDVLKQDVATLRSALQRSDDQLQGLLKASTKAQKHESHARNKLEVEFKAIRTQLEERLRDALDRCAVFEAQVSHTGMQATTLDKEVTRWKVEAQRMQHELGEAQRVIKELKKRHRELIPKDSHTTELAQIEDRHRVLLGGTEKELQRARDEARDEAGRASRAEVVLADLRSKINELQASLAASQRHSHDLELAVAQEKLLRAQCIEEIRLDHGAEVKAQRERADRAYHERNTFESELAVARQHIQELEAAARSNAKKFHDTEESMLGELQRVKTSLSDAQIELETTRRLSHQHELALTKCQTKIETIREESREEILRIRSEHHRAEEMITRHEAQVVNSERACDELRMQLATLSAELSNERTATLRKEQEWRNKICVLDEQVRLKDEEKRQQAETYESTLRQRENEYLFEKSSRIREYQKTSTDSTQLKQELEDRIGSAEARAAQLKAELANARQDLDAKVEKEKSTMGTIKQQDEMILRLQLDLSERDACIVTLRRNLTASATAQRNTEELLESTNQALDLERRRGLALEQKLEATASACAKKDEELGDISKQMRRIEEAARSHDADTKRETEQLRERIQQLSQELHSSQQQIAVGRIELERVQTRSSDERSAMQREVLVPLQSRVELLVTTNQKLSRESQEREERLTELTRANARLQEQLSSTQSELNLKERKVSSLSVEVTTASEQLSSARRLQAQANAEKEDHRRTKSELESLQRKIAALEQQAELQAKELGEYKDRDFNLTHELNTKKAELAMLRERYANLESLKSINDGTVAELQVRERELIEKLEEMRSAQQMMQMCFDKQQEQLEVGRRMRDHHESASVTRTLLEEVSSSATTTRRK